MVCGLSLLASSYSSPISHRRLFPTTHLQDLRYLGLVDSKPHKLLPSPDHDITHTLIMIDYFKSKSFLDSDFPRLASLCPKLFSLNLDVTDIDPVFQFFTTELHASLQDSRTLVLHCPHLLLSDVEYCLRPTLSYLKHLNFNNLNVPTSLNAHLLNTRVEKLRSKLKFLKSIGFSHEEAGRACARLPAIFRYSIENNLTPKFEFLEEVMGRSVEELKEFPQYFGFSLEKRIAPRHWHLKHRNVQIKLNRMLIWGDDKFYAKWK